MVFQSIGLTAVSSGSRIASDLKRKNTSFEPRVTLDYQPNDDQLYYLLFSKGVKSGRWNTSSASPAVGGFRPEGGFLFAPPEELFNYEVGAKFTFLDGNATLNLAAFYQNVKDQQLRQTVQINEDFNNDGMNDILNQIFTAGDSRIWGFEIEGTARFDALSLRASVGYSDHEFSDDIRPSADFDLFQFADNVAAGNETLRGKTSVNVPKLTANFSAQYDAELSDDWDLALRTDVIYSGSKYVELANLAKIPAYAHVNARATLSNKSLTFALFGNNLFNDRTAAGAGLTGTSTCEFQRNGPNLPAYSGAQRCIYLVPQRGREVGLRASIKF